MELKKYSKENDYSYSFGAFPTYELITKKGEYVSAIILHEKLEQTTDIKKIISLAKDKKINIITNGKLLEKLSGKGNVFIAGVFKKYPDENKLTGNTVLLVNPSDMGNLGTIVRAMLGFGYNNLALITPCIDVFDPKVVRASMGAIFSVNIKHYDCVEKYLSETDNTLYPFMLQATTSLQSLATKQKPNTLIFGNEATGLPKNYLDIGTPLIINHSDKIDSLNLSMSVCLALYEFSK